MKNSLFQILSDERSGQYVVGGGVILSDDLLITCTHVAEYANTKTKTVNLGDRVRVRFPFAESKPVIDCVVEGFKPLDASRAGDMLLMKADSPLNNVAPPCWGMPRSGFTMRAIGFPGAQKADIGGQWAYGVLRDRGATAWQQIEDETSGGYWVKPGFSGFPVWQTDSWVALGLVCAADLDSQRRVAFAIPSLTLINFAVDLTGRPDLQALRDSFEIDRVQEVKALAAKKLGKFDAAIHAGAIRVLADHLNGGEILKNMILSPITNIPGTQFVRGLLAATDRRFIFIYKIPGAPPIIKDYNYWDVKRLLFAWGQRLIIESGDRRRLSLAEFSERHMEELTRYANQRIDYFQRYSL